MESFLCLSAKSHRSAHGEFDFLRAGSSNIDSGGKIHVELCVSVGVGACGCYLCSGYREYLCGYAGMYAGELN